MKSWVAPFALPVIILLGFGVATPANGDVILVSASNANPLAGGLLVASGEYLQQSWTQNADYAKVSISAWVFGTIFTGGIYVPTSGAAYLTSSLPGASELKQTFVFPDPTLGGHSNGATQLTFFSGLTLPAGTYYLTLASTDPAGGGWAEGGLLSHGMVVPYSVTLADGVTLGGSVYAQGGGLDPADPPQSAFTGTGGPGPLFFEVKSAQAPETSSIVLLGSVILGLLMILRTRNLANRSQG